MVKPDIAPMVIVPPSTCSPVNEKLVSAAIAGGVRVLVMTDTVLSVSDVRAASVVDGMYVPSTY